MTPKRQLFFDTGRCLNFQRCGNARGKDGTKLYCRPCADERSSNQSQKNADARLAQKLSKRCSAPGCDSRRGIGARGKLLKVCTAHAIEQQERSRNYRARRRRLRAG